MEGTAGQKKTPVHSTVPDILSVPSNSDRHEFILAQFVGEFCVSTERNWKNPLKDEQLSWSIIDLVDDSIFFLSCHCCPITDLFFLIKHDLTL